MVPVKGMCAAQGKSTPGRAEKIILVQEDTSLTNIEVFLSKDHHCDVPRTANNTPVSMQEPLHLPKVTVWSDSAASAIIRPYLSEENRETRPVTYTVSAYKYADMLQNLVILQLQQ
ncbi:hypothetical protein TNCV_2905151 [Trichonephila clavipes]|nr:hypothetical protein TNCV_2905151 [Trichonephila clavipes]